ncbi:unnamed protein product [Cuscuta campestris]|uniref:BHLH domain-containing protein n=1 Tax=Cuscuta campestris TaxID=132261 RepID=A0A484NHS6_9ASTE|nr:unnamed protein product [Cuscuta campestris]
MFSSEAEISRETKKFLCPADQMVPQDELQKIEEIFESDHQRDLMRYSSAPSSFFDAMLDISAAAVNGGAESFPANNDGSSSSDSETMFSSILTRIGSGHEQSPLSGNGRKGLEVHQEMTGYGALDEIGSYGVEMEMHLIRQSSSPPDFFSGFDMREAGNDDGFNNNNNNNISYSSAQSCASNFIMPIIAENESWNDSSYNCLKRTRNGDFKMLSALNNVMEAQNESEKGGQRNCEAPGLIHQMSLPSTSAEMETYLQFQQGVVPCKTRAKRGCATHPRSIAERKRRTRISERMKKLQELIPKFDKQTSTADMLDWAVEHIKELQTQVQILRDNKAKCTCSSEAQLN